MRQTIGEPILFDTSKSLREKSEKEREERERREKEEREERERREKEERVRECIQALHSGDVSGCDWANLQEDDLWGANLYEANLYEANLYEANLALTFLAEADLRGANLTGANLTGAYLGLANLTGAYLGLANLTGAYLTGAYLAGAYLGLADLTGADLTGADLTGADLTGADLTGADLTDTIGLIRDCEIPDPWVWGTNLSGCDFSGVDLSNVDLTDADLRGADMRDANLTGAILMGADLTGAKLQGANLKDADLRGALEKCIAGDGQLSTSSCHTIPDPLPSADLSGANLTNTALQRADLTGAILTGADLAGAVLDGADFAGAVGVLDADGLPQYVPCELPDDLRYAELSKCDLYGANLQDRDMTGAVLDWANLRGQSVIIHESDDNKQTFWRVNDYNIDNFDKKYFAQAGLDFTGTRLGGADLSGAKLRYADLSGQTLDGTILEDADLTGAGLWAADLTGATLRNATFVDAVLDGASLVDNSVLRGADFSRAKLTGANLSGTYHTLTVFTGATLIDADLDRAVLSIADFSHADLSNATMRDTEFNLVDMKYTTLIDAVMKPSDITTLNMTGANVNNLTIKSGNKASWEGSTADITETWFKEACRYEIKGIKSNKKPVLVCGDDVLRKQLDAMKVNVIERDVKPNPNPVVWAALCMAPGALDFVVPVPPGLNMVGNAVSLGGKTVKIIDNVGSLHPAKASAERLMSIVKPAGKSGEVLIDVGDGARTVTVAKQITPASLRANDGLGRDAATAALAAPFATSYVAIEQETTGTNVFGWVMDKFRWFDASHYVSLFVENAIGYDCTCNAPGWYKATKTPQELNNCE